VILVPRICFIGRGGDRSGSAFLTQAFSHENKQACRRQAPAWLISELLSKFPESANYANNQGELPLHIAVDKACAPEVVNLIIVANWKAIVAQDQAGRTPLDIIDRGELLQLEDYRIVFESLRRCYKTYMDIQRAAQEEQASLKRKQKATFSAISHRHQEELKAEHDKQAKIRDEVEDLKAQIEDMKEVSKAKDHKMKKHQLEKERWSETIRDLEASAGGLKEEVELRKAQIRSLENSVRQKESELIEKGTIINLLSQDLKNIAISNDTELMHSLVEAEDSMRKMVSKQIALQKLLASKSESLTGLLNQRGISLRAERRAPNITEEKSDKDPTSAMDDEEAASAAMMAAALSALQRVNS
jgi:chromosome segregation ATPase